MAVARRLYQNRAMLHVTNGDAAVERMRAAGIAGDILPWRDVLHEGPVPAGVALRELSSVRARFIAEAGWGALAAVERDFAARDAAIAAYADHDELVLWFEHDLYDQLQLVQVLAWLADEGGVRARAAANEPARVSLVQTDDYLGTIAVERLQPLFERRAPVREPQLAVAVDAWRAFTAPDPTEIERFLAGAPGLLPFLAAALRRHLEELPWVERGLSRTERQALEAIATGPTALADAYRAAHHEREGAIFLGDAVFAWILERLGARASVPLAALDDGRPFAREGGGPALWRRRVALTDAGRAVLAGELDHVRANGIDRWLGGVHLCGRDARWRWDGVRGSVVAGS